MLLTVTLTVTLSQCKYHPTSSFRLKWHAHFFREDVWFLKEDKDVKLKGKEDDSDASDRKGEYDESIDLTSVPVSNRKCNMKVLNENVS